MLALEMQRRSSLTEAMGAVASRLEGAFTLVAVSPDAPDTVVAARRNSTLVVGLGQGAVSYTHLTLPTTPYV